MSEQKELKPEELDRVTGGGNDSYHGGGMFWIVESICVGCAACKDICPFGAIERHGDVYRINERYCTRCMHCVDICRHNAIRQG